MLILSVLKRLAWMRNKDSAILINTSRGSVVDEEALYRALTTGKIAGAGLDVMVQEPPKTNHSLFKLDNAIITPHMAGPTVENGTKAFRNGFDSVQRVAAGRAPMWVIPGAARVAALPS